MNQPYEKLQIELKSLLQKRETAYERVRENDRIYQHKLAIFEKESDDVERLEEQSLSTFIQNLFGNHEAALDKEKQDVISAKIELDSAAALLQDAEDILVAIDDKVNRVKAELSDLREQLSLTDAHFKEKVSQDELELLSLKQEEKELGEAIYAGENVLRAIDDVLKELDSAHSMATWDLFADSLLVDLMKYNKIDSAEKELNNLERYLDRYQNELKDVDLQTSIAYEELGQMSRAFDIFFDNIFSDWNTRDTIDRNRMMLEDMMVEVEDVQELLIEREEKIQIKIQTIQDIIF